MKFKNLFLLSLISLSIVASSTAFAGARINLGDVWLPTPSNNGYSSIYGQIAIVRATSNRTEYLGCGTSYRYNEYYKTSAASGFCVARDKSSNYRSCYTRDEELMKVIRSIQDDSRLVIRINPQGECVTIRTGIDSRLPPKY